MRSLRSGRATATGLGVTVAAEQQAEGGEHGKRFQTRTGLRPFSGCGEGLNRPAAIIQPLVRSLVCAQPDQYSRIDQHRTSLSVLDR